MKLFMEGALAMSPSRRRLALVLTGLMSFGLACSDDEEDRRPVSTSSSGGGGAGGEGSGGEQNLGGAAGGEPVGAVELVSVTAPSEREVELLLSGDLQAEPLLDPGAYVISSPRGALEVTAVSYDAGRRTLLLATARQKLGVAYELALSAPGTPVDGQRGEFLAADTATLWATDFADSRFADYQVFAERRAVGEHAVIYVEQGMEVSDVEDTLRMFDETIFPRETQLFGAAPDVDGNGKIVLLGLDGGGYYGGYFNPINTLSDEVALGLYGIHSNQMDMLYINVSSAPTLHPVEVVTHELGHLLYEGVHAGEPVGWPYHNEGLAECAVRAVWGENRHALAYFQADPSGRLGTGESLVHWEYGNYDQYVLAYLFWSYVASRLGGVDSYADLFRLYGDPLVVDGFLTERLGGGFSSTQLDWMIATWLRRPEGPSGYGEMIAFPDGFQPHTVPAGTPSVHLSPFAGAYFQLGVSDVDYPGTQGENIVYAGIDGDGNIDREAPFHVEGGALLVLNTELDAMDPTPEASGLSLAGTTSRAPRALRRAAQDLAWLHPPPLDPRRREALHAWRDATAFATPRLTGRSPVF